jgi:site-specific DNA-cytosine methylase
MKETFEVVDMFCGAGGESTGISQAAAERDMKIRARYQGSHEGEADGDTRSHAIERPLPTVDTSNRYGLVEPSANPRLDIRFRMLKNHELKKAQGFPDDYVITGNTTEQTKQIGAAVPVNTAKALALVTMGSQ